jgi:hypothetical protein
VLDEVEGSSYHVQGIQALKMEAQSGGFLHPCLLPPRVIC